MNNSNIRSFVYHLSLFIIIEILFVLIIFRELPTTNLLSLIWILHTSYRLAILLAWWLREQYTRRVWQKFLCTYLPVLYHVFIHVYISIVTLHEMTDEHHDEHSMTWLIVGTVSVWVLIALGEYWLHRTTHCETHHISAHKHCHDGDCEESHEKAKDSL